MKRWKLSQVDLASLDRWDDYTRADPLSAGSPGLVAQVPVPVTRRYDASGHPDRDQRLATTMNTHAMVDAVLSFEEPAIWSADRYAGEGR